MPTLPQLWQRLFVYAFILILVSPAVGFVIIHWGIEKDMNRQILSELTGNAAEALQGRDIASAEIFLDFFNREKHQAWLVNEHSEVLAGQMPQELTRDTLAELIPVSIPNSEALLFEGNLPSGMQLVRTPVNLKSGQTFLYLFITERPRPPISIILIQSAVAVVLIGGVLSAWLAWSISRPLRRLRRQVLEIADGNLDKRVDVPGTGEVAEVAQAVNSLAKSLSRHIRGMRELLANISHEMRSPLARMSISTAIIEEGLNDPAQTAEAVPPLAAPPAPRLNHDNGLRLSLAVKHVRNLQQEINHLEKLIGSTLLTSKLDLQQQTPDFNDLDFSLLCSDLARRHELVFQDRGIVFEEQISEGLWVKGDEALLNQIISNLLDNACKYTEPGGLARLGLCREQGLILLSMENTAAQFSPAELTRLREPFYRYNAATGSGVGLGLALVDKIASSHDGTMEIDAGELGFRIIISLPEAVLASEEFLNWFYTRHMHN